MLSVLTVLFAVFCHNLVKFLHFHLSKSSLLVVGPGKTPCAFSSLDDPCSSSETGKPNLKLGSSSISAIFSTTKAFQFLLGSFLGFLYEFTTDLHVMLLLISLLLLIPKYFCAVYDYAGKADLIKAY